MKLRHWILQWTLDSTLALTMLDLCRRIVIRSVIAPPVPMTLQHVRRFQEKMLEGALPQKSYIIHRSSLIMVTKAVLVASRRLGEKRSPNSTALWSVRASDSESSLLSRLLPIGLITQDSRIDILCLFRFLYYAISCLNPLGDDPQYPY